MPTEPVVPAYGGACIASLAPALLKREAPPWLPAPAAGAAQVVLLVLDGLGWEQLRERAALAPTLAAMAGGPITSVAPTTTATALTSITTGLAPAEHGVMGYVVKVGDDLLNVLRWRTAQGDARETVPPAAFMPHDVFGGAAPPVVSRAEFFQSGFTEAHLRGARMHGWQTTSSLAVEVETLLAAGEPFVYAYYDGVDKVAHAHGLSRHYEAEVRFADRMVAELIEALPPRAALVVTADHGQVDVGDRCVDLAPDVLADVDMVSGEARFRWLHARPGLDPCLLAERARAAHGEQAWVHTREEAEAAGWFGGPLSPAAAARVGDVAVVAREPVAFLDPRERPSFQLRSRHGSLTGAEMWVPLLAASG